MRQPKPPTIVHSSAARRCWRMVAVPDVVLFHGHHAHEFMPHMHDVATVILVTEGIVEIEIEGLHYRVEAGGLVTIGAWQVHSARPIDSRGWEMRSMHLPVGLLPALDDAGSQVRSATSPPRPWATEQSQAGLFLDMHRSSEEAGHEEHQVARLRAFAESLPASLEARVTPSTDRPDPDARLSRARELIEKTVFENVPMDGIAEEVGLSTFTLIRRFKSDYGMSPHAWRMQARANAAAKCLRDKVPLSDAAGSCGFFDQAHMSRVFKKVFGVTPGQYSHMH
jgi:AraC-like DNA-binding protein/mannose-6-phosphate isomerase-like protein (cupin superfamily)